MLMNAAITSSLSFCLLLMIMACSKQVENVENTCFKDWIESDESFEMKTLFHSFRNNPSRLVPFSKDYYMVNYTACNMCCRFTCMDEVMPSYTSLIGRINDEYWIETVRTNESQCNSYQLFERKTIPKEKYTAFIEFLNASELPCKRDTGHINHDSIIRFDALLLARKVDSSFFRGNYIGFNPNFDIIPEFGQMMNRFFPMPQEYLFINKSKIKNKNTLTVIMDIRPFWLVKNIRITEDKLVGHKLKKLENLSADCIIAEIELMETEPYRDKHPTWEGVLEVERFGAEPEFISFSISLYRGVTEYE